MMHGATIDSKRFRSVIGSFPTGVAVIGIECDGELFGATINSLTSVSLAPCMLLFCTNEASATGAAIPRFIGASTLALLRARTQQPRQMPLIFRWSALCSLMKGSFGSVLRQFFSCGTSFARGWRWPIGAGGIPPAMVWLGEVPLLPVWAVAAPTSRRASSASKPIALIMFAPIAKLLQTVGFGRGIFPH
jgi:hypothetical protein